MEIMQSEKCRYDETETLSASTHVFIQGMLFFNDSLNNEGMKWYYSISIENTFTTTCLPGEARRYMQPLGFSVYLVGFFINIVYRRLDSATFFKIKQECFMDENAFLNVSIDKEIALRYARSAAERTNSVPVLLKIKVRKGTRVAWMPSIAEDIVKEREFELLFPPDNRIIIFT